MRRPLPSCCARRQLQLVCCEFLKQVELGEHDVNGGITILRGCDFGLLTGHAGARRAEASPRRERRHQPVSTLINERKTICSTSDSPLLRIAVLSLCFCSASAALSAPRGFSTDFERSRDLATSVRTGSQTCKDTPRHSSGVHTSVHTADCLLGTTERGKNGQRGTRSVGKLSPTPGTRKTTTVPNPGWRKARQRRKRRRKIARAGLGCSGLADAWQTPQAKYQGAPEGES